jgi:hypothetical protein
MQHQPEMAEHDGYMKSQGEEWQIKSAQHTETISSFRSLTLFLVAQTSLFLLWASSLVRVFVCQCLSHICLVYQEGFAPVRVWR